MARLVTCGFEMQSLATTADQAEGEGFVQASAGTPTVETTTVRSGSAALRSNADSEYVQWGQSFTDNRAYFFRFYMRVVSEALTGTTSFMLMTDGATEPVKIRMGTDASIFLADNANVQIGSASSPLNTGQWYRIELKVQINTAGNDTVELRVDGTTITNTTAAISSTLPSIIVLGILGLTGAVDLIFDDVALNDDQGANQNSWPGEGKLNLLTSVSDNARNGMQGGAGATTNLYDAVNNTPPVGVSDASATNTSQIEGPTNATTDTYDANLATYGSIGGGIAASNITLVQSLATIGQSSATARSVGQQMISNPVIAETAASGTTSAMGTYPSAWRTRRGTVTYAPSVTLETGPVMRVRKATATTDRVDACLMGLYVEYAPESGIDKNRHTNVNQAVNRASTF